jgi:hypothetical protein
MKIKAYARGGRVPEQKMEAVERNREEIGLPGKEGNLSTLIDQIPGIGLAKVLGERADANDRLANPEYLHNTAGKGLETNYQHGAPWDKFGQEADVQMMSEGGIAGVDGLMSNPNPEPTIPETGTAGEDDDDPAIIPEDIKEFVKDAHKERQESRPDESWRIVPAPKEDSMAPYKQDEEDMAAEAEEKPDVISQLKSMGMNYDTGGATPGSDFQVDGGDSDTLKMNGQMPPPADPMVEPEAGAPTDEGPGPNDTEQAGPATVAHASPSMPIGAQVPPPAPLPTDQTYMDRANKVLGLGPDQQAGLMKLLGQKQQTGQIGAGIAGIGDAIASGGTLGKVNPGGLAKSEDLLANKTKEGIEGMQTIRGNQEKAAEMADKLEARDPNSPLSKYAQKAYASVGKKIGIDLSHAPASLIADVTGKGVDALNTEFQGQIKVQGLDLQKQQVAATIANQKAERHEADTTRQADAAKTLAGQGIMRKGLNQLTSSGRDAQKVLQNEATGVKSFNSVEEAEGAGLPVGTRVSIGGRMATIK